jgi:hypothetical protein
LATKGTHFGLVNYSLNKRALPWDSR